MNKQKFLNYALIVVLTILVMQLFSKPQTPEDSGPRDDIEITAKDEYNTGEAVILNLRNNTDKAISFDAECPGEPFLVKRYRNGEWKEIESTIDEGKCDTKAIEIPSLTGVKEATPSTNTVRVTYQPWQRDLFTDPGKYRIEIPFSTAESEKVFLHEFEVVEPGTLRVIGRTLFYRPIYNGLIFFTKLTGNSFGLGIVLLTLLLRLLLFVPFQKSLKSQRRMQKIQPEIDAIKKKYAGNQQMVAMETMALMKKHKVSPLGSCLPMLIQMPFLLALFWATRDGLGENNVVYLYDFLKNFDFSIVSTNFIGLDLIKNGSQYYFALPIFLFVIQFAQMKLAMAHTKKHAQKKTGENPMADAMQSMTKFMPYFLPFMIAIFAASMPVAVGIYWGTSTLFSVGQQIIVNKQIK